MSTREWEEDDIQYIDSDVDQIVEFLYHLNQDEQDQLSDHNRIRFNGSERLYDAVNNVRRANQRARGTYYPDDTNISYYYELYGTLKEAWSGMNMILKDRTDSAMNMIRSSRSENEVMQATMYMSKCDMEQMHINRVMSSLAYKTIHLLHPGSVERQ
jgi:hypothetical protein